MRAILEFNLDDRSDEMAHFRAVKSLDMAITLFDIEQLLFKDETEDVEIFKNKIRDIFETYNINVSELVE